MISSAEPADGLPRANSALLGGSQADREGLSLDRPSQVAVKMRVAAHKGPSCPQWQPLAVPDYGEWPNGEIPVIVGFELWRPEMPSVRTEGSPLDSMESVTFLRQRPAWAAALERSRTAAGNVR